MPLFNPILVEPTQRFQEIKMDMKVFQSVETNYKRMGFVPSQAQPKRPLNLTILIGFVVLGFASVSECILLLQATTFELYVESIYVTSATIMFVTIYTASVIRIPYLYRFINTYQRVVDASESENALNLSVELKVAKISFLGLKYRKPKSIYEQTHKNVEKWTAIVDLFVAKSTVFSSVLPKLIVSLITYSDLGNDAFVLPVPMWLVDLHN